MSQSVGFVEATERVGGLQALEEYFRVEVEWEEGVRSNMLCELIW